MAKEYKILSPTAILGYGFPEESFMRGIAEHPDLIAVDAGSTDPGPYYLGAGKSFTDRTGVKGDLRYMLTQGIKNHIPIVIGTAGGSGARPHVEWCRKIIEEIAAEEKLSFRMGIVYADVDKEAVVQAIEEGVTSVHIIDGRKPHSILYEAFTSENLGTTIGASQESVGIK